jgi:hypothetical protein
MGMNDMEMGKEGKGGREGKRREEKRKERWLRDEMGMGGRTWSSGGNSLLM